MEQAQGPVKGTLVIDLLDAAEYTANQRKEAGLDPYGFDPIELVRRVGLQSRETGHPIVVEPERFKETYGKDSPINPIAARDLVNRYNSGEFNSPVYQKPKTPRVRDSFVDYVGAPNTDPADQMRRYGISRIAEHDPYSQAGAAGPVPFDTDARLAPSRGFFVDKFGQVQQLKTDSHEKKDLVVDYQTDEFGFMDAGDRPGAPYLRELKDGEDAYGKTSISKMGYQERERNWLSAYGVGFGRGAAQLPAYLPAIYDGIWGDMSHKRLQTLVGMRELYNSPSKSMAFNNAAEFGDFHTGLENAYDGLAEKEVSEETAHAVYQQLKQDEEMWRERAKQGDRIAQINTRIIDMGDGLDGRSAMNRIAASAHLWTSQNLPVSSVRSEEGGAFGSMEGFFEHALGQTSGQFALQIPATNILGGAIGSLATRSLMKQAMVSGTRAAATAAARQGSARAWTAAGFEGLQMLDAGVQSYHEAHIGQPDDNSAALFGVATAVGGVTISRMLGVPWFSKSFENAGGKKAYAEMLRTSLGKTAKMDIPMSQRVSYAMSDMIDFLHRGSENAWVNKSMKIASASLQEGIEEGGQEAVNIFGEFVTDRYRGDDGFASQRPDDYSTLGRIFEAAAIGAIGGGGMSAVMNAVTGAWNQKPKPYDQSVWEASVNGNGASVIAAARSALKRGEINADEFNVVQQDVQRAESASADFRMFSNAYQEYLKKQPSITSEYAEAAKNVAQLTDEINAAEPGSDTTSLQEQLKQQQAIVNDILGGRRLAEQVVRDAQVQSSFHRMAEGGGSGAFAIDPVAVVEDYGRWANQQREAAKNASLVRPALLKEFNEAIKAIKSSTGKNFRETALSLNDVVARMSEAKIFTREDRMAVHEAHLASYEKAVIELGSVDLGGESEDLPTDILSMATAFAESRGVQSTSAGDELAAWLDGNIGEGVTGQNRVNDDGDDAAQESLAFFRDARIVQGGLTQSSAEKSASALPSQEEFLNPGSPDNYFNKLRVSTSDGATARIDAQQVVDMFREKESATENDLSAIASYINELRSLREVVASSSSIIKGLDGIMSASKSVPPGVAEMNNRLRPAMEPISKRAAMLGPLMDQSIRDLEKEHIRLGQALDIRMNNIEIMRQNDMGVSGHMINALVTLDAQGFGSDKEVSRLVSDLNDPQKAEHREATIIQLKQKAHEAFKKDPSLADALLKKIGIDSKVDQATGGYLTNSILVSIPVQSWSSQMVFDPQARSEMAKALQEGTKSEMSPNGVPVLLDAAVNVLATNWVLSTLRVSPRLLVSTYNNVIERYGVTPSYEQQQRIMEAAAFMANPTQDDAGRLIAAMTGKKAYNYADGAIWLNGFPGTGKTTMCAVSIAVAAQMAGTKNVLVVTPGENEAKATLVNNIKKAGPSIAVSTALIEDLRSIDLAQYDHVVVDESHVMSILEAKEFHAMSRGDGTRPSIMVIGDPGQMSSMNDVSNGAMAAGMFVERLVPLSTSFRTGDVEMLTAFNDIRRMAYSNSVRGVIEPTLPASRYTSGQKNGVRWIGGPGTDVSSVLEVALGDLSSGDAMVVVLGASDRATAVNRLKQLASERNMPSSINTVIDNRVRTMEVGDNSALGMEVDRVYVAIDPTVAGKVFTRALYTAISRARNSFTAYLPNGRSSMVGSLPSEASTSTTAEALKKERTKALSDMASVLGSLKGTDMLPKRSAPTPSVPLGEVPSADPTSGPNSTITTPVDQTNSVVAGPPSEPDADTPTDKEPPRSQGLKSYGDVRRLLVEEKYNSTDMSLGIYTGVYPFSAGADPHTPDNHFYNIRRIIMDAIIQDPAGQVFEMVYMGEGVMHDTRDSSGSSIVRDKNIAIRLKRDVDDSGAKGHVTEVAKYLQAHNLDPNNEDYYVIGYAPSVVSSDTELFTNLSRLDGKTSGLTPGMVIPGYERIPATRVLPGVPDAAGGPMNVGDFMSNMERQGLRVSNIEYGRANTHLSTGGGSAIRATVNFGLQDGADLVAHTYVTNSPWKEGHAAMLIAAAHSQKASTDWNKNRVKMALGSKNMLAMLTQYPSLQEFAYVHNGYLNFERATGGYNGEFDSMVKFIKEVERLVLGGAMVNIDGRSFAPELPLPFLRSGDLGQPWETPEIMAVRNEAIVEKPTITQPIIQLDMRAVWAGKDPIGQPKSQVANSDGDVPDMGDLDADPFYKENNDPEVQYQLVSEAREYVRRVLGNRFVDGKLEFKPNLRSLSGRALHGVMQNASILINEKDGMVEHVTARHEAMHYVVVHLLHPSSAASVLNEAREKDAIRRGIRVDQVTDRDAHEYLAGQFETAKSSDGLVGRFVTWLKGALSRWGLYRLRIEELNALIDSGHFANTSPRQSDVVTYLEKEDESNEHERQQPLARIFGSEKRARNVLRHLRTSILSTSGFQQPKEGSMGIRPRTIKESVELYYNSLFQRYRSMPDGTSINGEQVLWNDLSEEQVALLSGSDLLAYATFTSMKPVVLQRMLKQVLPGIRSTSVMPQTLIDGLTDEIDADMMNEVETDPVEGQASMANIINSHEERDPLTNKLAMSLVMQDMVAVASSNGLLIEDPRERIYENVLQTVFRNAVQGIYIVPDGDPLKAIGKAVLKQYTDSPLSIEGKHALTIYHRFFAQGEHEKFIAGGSDPENNARRSYLWVLRNQERLRNQIGDDPFKKAALEERISMAERITASIPWMFSQLHTNAYIKSSYLQKDSEIMEEDVAGGVYSKRLSLNSQSTERQTMNAATDQLFHANNENVSINASIRSLFKLGLDGDNDNAQWMVGPMGVSQVFDGRDVPLVSRSGQGFKMATDNIPVINRFFASFGYDLRPSAIKELLSAEGGIDLANTIGMWSYAVRAGVSEIQGAGSSWSNDVINAFAKNGGVNFSEEGSGFSDIPRPSGFFELNRTVATVNARHRGSDYLRQVFNEAGKQEYVDNTASQFKRTLPATHPKGYSSAAIEENNGMYLRMDPALRLSDGRWLSPLFDPNDQRRVNSVSVGMGMQEINNGRGKSFNDLHPADQSVVILERFFAPLLSSNGYVESLNITLSPFADRKPVMITMDNPAGMRRLFNLERSGKRVKSVSFNDAVSDQWIKERFELMVNRARVAKQEVASVFGDVEIGSIPLDALRASSLIENYHYAIKGDVAVPGNALSPSDPILSVANARKVMLAGENLRSVVEEIFRPHVQQYLDAIKSNDVILDDVFRLVENGSEELLRGFFITSWLADQWVGDATMGPDALYKNSTDRLKRGSLPFAPAFIPMVRPGEEISSSIIISEPIDPATGLPGKQLDGQGYETPWGYLRLLEGYGHDLGPLKPGAFKMVYSDPMMIDKASRAMPTPSLFRQNMALRSWIDRSLSSIPELHSIWTTTLGNVDPESALPTVDENGVPEGEAFAKRYWDAAQKVLDAARSLGAMNQLPQFITSESNIKKGKRLVNGPDGNAPFLSVPIDLRFYGFQTDLSRDMDRLEVSQMTQILFMLGVMPGNADVVQRIQNIDKSSADAMIEEIRSASGGTREGFDKWLKSNSLKAAISKEESDQLIDALLDPGTTVNDPMVSTKLISDLLTKLYREGINPKVHGQQFTQVSAYGLSMMDTPPIPPMPNMDATILEAIGSLPSDINEIDAWNDDYSSVIDKESALYEIIQEMKGIRSSLNEGTYQNDQEVNDAYEAKRGAFNDLKQEAGTIKEYIDQQEKERQSPSPIMRPLKGPSYEGGKYVPGEIMLPFVYAKQFGVTNPYMTLEDMRTDIFDRLGEQAAKVFEDSLLVFVSRTPSSGTSSGHFARVVGFINDSGNSIYVPEDFNKLTGGDNDGDQLTVLFRAIQTKDGLPSFSSTGKGKLSNDLMDSLWAYYSNPANQEHTMAQIGTSGLSQAAEGIAEVARPALHSPLTAMIQRKHVQDGASLVGVIANANKAYSIAMGLWNSLGKSDVNNAQREGVFKAWQPMLRDSNNVLVGSNISELLNGALDNAKLLILGPMGIEPANINLALGALSSGLSLEGLARLMADPLIKRATNAVADTKRMVRYGYPQASVEMDEAILGIIGATPEEQRDPDYQKFIQFVHIGEVLSRIATMVKHRNSRLGSNEREFMQHVRQLEFIMNTPLSDIVEGLPSDGSFYKSVGETIVKKSRLKREASIRSLFDHGMMARSLNGLMAQYALINEAQTNIGASFVNSTPFWTRTEERLSREMIGGGPFKYDDEISFGQETTNYHISNYLDRYGRSITLIPGNGPIDMSTRGGSMRFLFEFPDHWRSLMEKIKQEHADNPIVKDNQFLKELRYNQKNGMVVLEVEESRRMKSSALRSLLRSDLEALSNLVGTEHGEWGIPLVRQIAIYSMLKDQFRFNRNSLMPFLPGTAFKPYGLFLSHQVDAFNAEPVNAVAERFIGTFRAYNRELFRKTGTDGPRVNPIRLVMPSQALHYGHGVIAPNGSFAMPDLSKGDYDDLYRGLAIPSDRKNDSVIELPIGASVSVVDGHISITKGSPYNADQDSDPIVLHSLTSDASIWNAGFNVSSLEGMDTANSLAFIRSRVSGPIMTSLVDRLISANEKVARPIRISSRELGENEAGFIEGNGDIVLNSRLGESGAAATLLHEITHRYTAHVLTMSDDQLTSEELAFKNGVTDLWQRAKGSKGAGRFEHALSSPAEFVAAAYSDPQFQQWLQVGQDGPVTMFDRFIKWLRSLLGLDAVHENILSQALDITDGYIQYATNSERTFDATNYQGPLRDAYLARHYHKAGRLNNSLFSGFDPITDTRNLIDRLQYNPRTKMLPSQQAEASLRRNLVSEIFNRTDQFGNKYRATKYTGAGKTWNFKGLSDKEVNELIEKQIIPQIRSLDNIESGEIIGILNGVKRKDGQSFREAAEYNWMSRFIREDGYIPKASVAVSHFLDEIIPDGMPATYLRYSELSNQDRLLEFNDGSSVRLRDVGQLHVNGFVGFDPIVRIARSDIGFVVDLFQFSKQDVGRFSTMGTDRHLLSNYLSGALNNRAYGMTTRDNVGGARRMALSLTAMAIRQANPKIRLRNIKTLALGSGFSKDTVMMGDMLREIGVMRTIPAMWDTLPESIKAVLSDTRLYDASVYQQSAVEALIDWAKENDSPELFSLKPFDPDDIRPQNIHKESMKALLRQFYESPSFDGDRTLEDMARLRASVIVKNTQEQFRGKDEDGKPVDPHRKAEQDPEYILLMRLIADIKDRGVRRKGTTEDATGFFGAEQYIANPHNTRSDAFARVQTAYLNAANKVVSYMTPFKHEHTKKIKLMERELRMNVNIVDRSFRDVGWRVFERLHRWSDPEGKGQYVIRDRDGKPVRRRINMIHWDLNDPETNALYKNGQLTKAELDYANWFLDQLEHHYREMLINDFIDHDPSFRDKNGQPDVAMAKERAEKIMDSKWQRGWIPVMRRPPSEAITSDGEFRERTREYVKGMGRVTRNVDALFDTDIDALDDKDPMGRIMNRYLAELDSSGSMGVFGSSTRMARMGLQDDGRGNVTIHDEEANATITQNLETVLNTFVQAAQRRIVMEKEVIPVYYSARAASHYLESEGKDQTAVKAQMEDYARRMIYGGIRGRAGQIENKSAAISVANLTMQATSYTALAFNWQVAIMSAGMNTASILSNSFANWAAKDGYYSSASVAKAVTKLSSPAERKKISALMAACYLHEMTEQDMANTQVGSHTRKQITGQRASNFMNQWTDREARAWIMTAQMIEDGSYDAYSIVPGKNGEPDILKYDETKDGRFCKNGRLTEDGALLRSALRARLVAQGLVGQDPDGPLKTGYDLMNSRTFKVLADKFVIGGMDNTTQAMAGSYMLGRAMLQFRRYIPDRIFNYFGKRVAVEGMGRDVIRVGLDGKKMAVWEQHEVESVLNAVVKGVHLLSQVRTMSIKEMGQSLDTADKRALYKGLSDLMMMASIISLMALLRPDDEEKDKALAASLLYDPRFIRIFESTASDAFAPWSLLEQSGGNMSKIAPSLGYMNRFVKAVFNTVDLEEASFSARPLTKILPYKTTTELFWTPDNK